MKLSDLGRRVAATVVTAVAATTLAAITATPAHAATISQCGDAYQVGVTAALMINGERAASVKQYWSPRCQQNFAYIYVWQSFRTNHPFGTWDLDPAVLWDHPNGTWTSEGGDFIYDTRQVEAWSPGFSGGGLCTQGYGLMAYPSGGDPFGSAFTDQRCG